MTNTGGYLFQHIVTASHVIEDINFEKICVRLNKMDVVWKLGLELLDCVFHDLSSTLAIWGGAVLV